MGFKANASSQGALKQAKIRRENFAQKNIQQRRQQNNNTDASTSSSTQQQQQQQQQKPLSEQEQIMRLAPPTIDQAKFLLQNVIESILIPKASEDLRRLFLTWAFNVQQQQDSVDDKANQNSASRRRQRDTEEKQDINRWTEISSVLKSLVENKSNLRAFVVDELASSVICALLRAGEKHIERNQQQQQQEEEFIGYVQQMIQLLDESTIGFRSDGADDDDNNNTDAAAEEENDDDSSGIAALSKHHVGRRIVCALLEAGNSSLRKRLNKILAARTLELINHRHGSVCLIRLLELYPKAAKTITPAALDNLQSYLSNPVSERVCEAMVAPSSAVTVLRAILDQVKSIDDKKNDEDKNENDDEKISSGFSKFVSGNKRNLRFLSRVLNDGFGKISSFDDATSTKQAIISVLSELVEKAKPLIIDMCFDERGNFFVQSLVRAVGAVNDKTLSQNLVKMILQSSSSSTTTTTTTASVSELLMNQHAVYVIIALGTVGGSVISNETTNVLRPHLAKLVLHQHGSLAVRKFIENSTASAEKIYEMLTTTATNTGGESSSSLIPQMITNEYGNMVVQSLLRTVSQPKRLEFFKKYLASSSSNNSNKLVEYSQHPFASRVIFLLVEEKNSKLLDAATHQAIFVALKPHILELAQHLNGRYIIEQLVVPHREVKEILATNFLHLAGAKGSQPVLVKLYESSDAAVRSRLANLVCANLSELSTNQASSITIQKLLQSDVQRSKTTMTSSSLEILEGVRKLLGLDTKTGAETSSSASNALLQRLRGDFFGRFVVSLAQGQEMSNSTHSNNNKHKH